MIRKTIALCALLFAGAVSAQTKISALTALAEAPASGDLVALVDVSDTTQAATGTTKKITASNLFLFRFPASSTDNAIARYDGTSGTLQNSGITVADVTGSSVTVATTAGNSLVVETTEPAATTGASVAGTTTALRAGDAVASTNTAGAAAGGAVTITGGAAARLTSGNANGGSIKLVPGAGIGTGTAGTVRIPDGALGAPAIEFESDADGSGSGIYRVAANSFGLVSNGVLGVYVTTTQVDFRFGLYSSESENLYGFTSVISANTGAATPNATTDSQRIFTNTGDSDGSTVALPDNPVAGVCYKFALTVAQSVTVTPNTGESLFMGADQCNVSMSASGDGATVEICAVVGGSGGQWNSFGASGWTCNDV